MIRSEPIMLLELPIAIMLLSIIPKTTLLCSKLCLAIAIVLNAEVTYNQTISLKTSINLTFMGFFNCFYHYYSIKPARWLHQ